MKYFLTIRSVGLIGLIGLAITTTLNLLALLLFKRASAQFFSDKWWSGWFTAYVVWLSFTAIGIAICWKRQSGTKPDA
jgi:hypothetical protein